MYDLLVLFVTFYVVRKENLVGYLSNTFSVQIIQNFEAHMNK